eukprot:73883_1
MSLVRYKSQKTIMYWIIILILFTISLSFYNQPYLLFLIDNSQTTNEYSEQIHQFMHLSNYTNVLLSTPFHFTCHTFQTLCSQYKILAIQKHPKNLHCSETITSLENDFRGNKTISPLFILSFRREFMSYIISMETKNIKIMAQCVFNFLQLFQSIHQSNFHSNNNGIDKLILSHLHVSKSAGSTIENVTKHIIEKLFNTSIHEIYADVVDNNPYMMHNLPRTDYIFDGMFYPYLKQQYFKSCDTLYKKLSSTQTVWVGGEIPLTTQGICSQFYNSIIIREPIEQSLSVLAYKTFDSFGYNGGLLCKTLPNKINAAFPCYVTNSINLNNYSKCFDIKQMKGIIKDLFNKNQMRKQIVKRAEKQWWKCEGKYCDCNRSKIKPVIEYFNKKYNFGIVYTLHNRNYIGYYKRMHRLFDTQQLKAWLSNTFVRYLGYNLVNNESNEYVLDAMLIDNKYINETHLNASINILLQFDYILPLSKKQRKYDIKIWDYYLKESVRIFSQNNKTKMDNYFKNNQYSFGNIRHLDTNQYSISGKSLYNLYLHSKELDILYRKNQYDLKLFELSKFIAYLDLKFFEFTDSNIQA